MLLNDVIDGWLMWDYIVPSEIMPQIGLGIFLGIIT
jgi:hypothetical protein